jgi:hypothetical protein
MVTLEKLGTMILEKRITLEKAQEIIDSSNTWNFSKEKEENFSKEYSIWSDENYCCVENSLGEKVAEASYYFDRDCFFERFLWLNEIESFEKNKGHFYRLFGFVQKTARKNKVTNIRLEVDNHNLAKLKFEKMGFYFIGSEERGYENINRSLMRYDLF